jgi:O-antigen/teichoic acid export membrane protein
MNWLSPTRYLTVTNIAGAGLGFGATIFVARSLGPERLGVMGVIASLNTAAAAFVDVRLNDLAAKAFYQTEGLASEAAAGYQAGVLWLALLGTALAAGLTALVSALLGNLFIPLFTAAAIERWWLPVDAFTLALTAVSGTLFYLLRFSREFYSIGNFRVVGQLLNLLTTVVVVTARPDLSGVYAAGLISAVAGVFVAAGVSWSLWTRRAALPLGRPDWPRASAAFRRGLGVLFYGNLLGYAKLLQRSLDVLVVAYFTGDRETGLYKLARQVVDNGLAVLQDALYQVYFPNFLELFAARAAEAYHALARRLLAVSALVAAALVAGEMLLLPSLVPLLFGPRFAGATAPIIILTSTFIFIVGFYPWLWAIFIGANQLRGFTVAAFVSVLAQYGVMLTLFAWAGASAQAAMLGQVAYYVCLIPAAYLLAARRWPAYLPGGLWPKAAG